MDKNDILYIFHSPHSPWGLRYRASKLPKRNRYRLLLETLADLLDRKAISRSDSRRVIGVWRSGKPDLAVSVLEKSVKKR